MVQTDLREIALLDRRGTNSAKWDSLLATFGQVDLLPLWVADMDFKAPKCVRDALHQAVEQGAFGYYRVPDAYYESILGWEKTQHGTCLQREWIRTTSGVVSGLFQLIQAITAPGDGILVQIPVYYPFYRVIRNTGRRAVYHPLTERNGIYTVDLEQFEQTIVAQRPKLFLLCSPHNPVGRVWREEELRGMLACCQRHQVQVVSDEIHHDILMPGHRHCSAARLWQGEGKPITFFSASKTFNLAGMKNSILVLPEEAQREQFDAFQRKLGISEGSTLDYIAVTAAFFGGKEWLEMVLHAIFQNACMLRETLSQFPEVVVSPLAGTYLMWIDLAGVVSREKLHDFVQNACHLAPDYGHWFFPEGEKSDTHIRLNLAAPQQTIQRAAEQLETVLKRVLRA